MLLPTLREVIFCSVKERCCAHTGLQTLVQSTKGLYLTEQSVQDSTLLCVDEEVFFAVLEAPQTVSALHFRLT